MPLNILHLSDIHFKYQLEGTIHDLDDDVRNELEIDVGQVIERCGQINAIVVTGDVAFAGKAADYTVAKNWLATLCKKVGCETEHVWVVPGNHDVDRAGVTQLVRTVQDSIQEADLDKIDRRIRQFIHEDPTGADVLERPLTEYYRFSSIYGCKPTPGNLTWEYNLALDMGYRLSLVGLNSALVSNENDHRRNRPLILGQAQLNLPRRRGYIYATLCHHPVSWLKDGESVHDKLCKRTSLQLFGHEHEQALRQVGSCLIVHAGALQPDRENGGPWCPAYNVVNLEAVESDTEHYLSVTAYPRVWCDDHCFSPDPILGGRPSQEFMLPLDQEIRIHDKINDGLVMEGVLTVTEAFADANAQTEQERNMVDPVRQLAYAFLTLPYSTQIRIANQLSLLEDDDAGLDSATLFERIYERAKGQGCLRDFWDHVSGSQPQGVTMMPNPYQIPDDREEKHHG